MYYTGHKPENCVVYIKFKFNWASHVLIFCLPPHSCVILQAPRFLYGGLEKGHSRTHWVETKSGSPLYPMSLCRIPT